MHLAYYRELSLFVAGVLAAECRWCLNDIEINERKTKLCVTTAVPQATQNGKRSELADIKTIPGENGGWNYTLSKFVRVCTPPLRFNIGSQVISGSSLCLGSARARR